MKVSGSIRHKVYCQLGTAARDDWLRRDFAAEPTYSTANVETVAVVDGHGIVRTRIHVGIRLNVKFVESAIYKISTACLKSQLNSHNFNHMSAALKFKFGCEKSKKEKIRSMLFSMAAVIAS